jgi:uroporphyrinogen decarboxylase
MKRQPDFNQFLKVLKREGKPDHLPFFEILANSSFIAQQTGTDFDRMPIGVELCKIYVDFWVNLGFDCVPLFRPLKIDLPSAEYHGGFSHGSEDHTAIRTMEDFEKFAWPSEESPIDFELLEMLGALLPDGVKLVAGVGNGPYEWLSSMMGTVGLSYALMDDPELVRLVAEKIGRLVVAGDRTLASTDAVGALMQGDDLGFKTSTFLAPDDLRRLIFPIYKQMTATAHDAGKPFILHSCGQLGEVYEDLIEDSKFDAKHSFEDAIQPVGDFKRLYGKRITPLGGLDVDMVCRGTEEELRAYTRKIVEECFTDGYWAFGTGNSLATYIPPENYQTCIDEAIKITS